MIGQVRYNQIGLVIKATVKNQDDDVVDISDATVKQLILEAPSGAKKTKTAVFVTDGSDGLIKYVTVDNDLDEVSEQHWEYQFIITRPSGVFPTDIGSFQVHRNL